MEDLWKFLEAEALDGVRSRKGKMTKMLVIVEIEEPDGSRTVRVSRHASGRRLRSAEEAGLLTIALTEVLDS